MADDSAASSDPIHEAFEQARNQNQSRTDIFKQREILEIDYVPDENRIVGRDDQIHEVVTEIAPAIFGNSPNSLVIYGKTGCGKSLVAKHVIQLASVEAQSEGTNLATAYVNCAQAEGNFEVVSTFGDEINPPKSAITFPSRGLSVNEYFSRLWEVLNNFYDGAIVVLDEIDKLADDNILNVLSRAGEDGSVDVPIGIIAISNKISFRNQLNERTKSSFGHNDLIFDPYDANQIEQILEHRRDAFVDGALDEAVIPKTAALSAKEHGDARKAMRLLRYAGDQAARQSDQTVTIEHLDAARSSAEADRLVELVSGLPPHTQYVLIALATLTEKHPDKEWFRTAQVVNKYELICEELGSSSLTYERVRQLLNETSFLQITQKRQGRGEGQGQYLQYRLLWEPEVVFELGSGSDLM